MNNKNLGFGIFLLSIGIIMLLVNLNIISWSVFKAIFDLWPAILVVIGINMIFNNNEIVKIITWLAFVVLIIAYGYFSTERHPIDFEKWTNGENIRIESNTDFKTNKFDIDF